MGYIDQKVTIWKRYHIKDEELSELIKDPEFGYSEFLDYTNFEFIYESEESLSFSDNGNQPTIEAFTTGVLPFPDTKMVWSNKPKQVLRDEKINEIIKEK